MHKAITILLFLFSIESYSQSKLDYGIVKADTAFNCLTASNSDSSFFGIKRICNSENELEIRLTLYGATPLFVQLIIITYDKGIWNAERFRLTNGTFGKRIDHTTFGIYNPAHGATYLALFNLLKDKNIFTLPDQEELKLPKISEDGGSYKITFKVKDQFRSYTYINPETYLSDPKYQSIEELYRVVSIVNTLKSVFSSGYPN